MHTSIDPNTTIGATALIVPNLDRSLQYYQNNIGLQLHERSGPTARLGVGGRDLLSLTEQPGAHPVQQGHTGLYHFAILVPSRLELARTLRHLIDSRTPICGASDHAVSEALYLTDPDGHGIEIYRDRPRSEWQFPNGTLRMTTDPFDVEGVLGELNGSEPVWTGLHPGTILGHIHLHVANIPAAERFYVDILGFDLMVRYGGQASFIAAGGYHHHMGLNTWAGVGAPPPPADAARLNWFEIRLPNETALAQVTERLQATNLPFERQGNTVMVDDPAQNHIHLVLAGG
ncbi:MAG: VOC family protein [Chloroflexi bacterium]|nr:VOC family protein [Chloroflexota bacterium]